MTTTTKHQPLKASGGTRTQSLASKSGHFLLHYTEMCLAMCVGAVILSVAFLGGFLNWQQPVNFMVGLLIIALAASSLIGRRKVSGPG